jgi:exoribonuclease-2
VTGGQEPVQLASAWLWLHGDQLWFRLRQQRISARPLDDLRRLRQKRHRQQHQQRQELDWHHAIRARRPVDPEQLAEQQRHELKLLERWAAGDNADPLPASLRQALQSAHCQAESGAIRHLLVDLGRWHPHHLPSLSSSCWHLGFSPELEAEAERLLAEHDNPQPGDGGRVDLSGQHCLTIDDDDTQDIDDGLALERRPDGMERLWIHVADPGRLVPVGSPLDLEARRRATSLYLARGTLPMFPLSLSTGPFSLRAGRRCAAVEPWPPAAWSAAGCGRPTACPMPMLMS